MYMHISDRIGSQIAELCVDLITWNSAGETESPMKLVLLGTLHLSGIPLSRVQPEPVFGIRESTVSKHSVWSQLLVSLAKKNMVLVRTH